MSTKEALNRWRANAYRNTLERIRDMNTLACAYLAEHPADLDEPVTKEWLQTLRLSPPKLMFDCGFDRDGIDDYNVRLNGSSIYMCKVETRGDVRALCLALKIRLTETK